MSHRYRLDPTAGQAATMRVHCGQARFVWNLALEHAGLHRSFGRYADQRSWDRLLAELRADVDWLAAGSSSVQQAALRDLRQAFRNWWGGSHRAPTKRSQRTAQQGFVIRDLSVRKVNRKWATVLVPKVGRVRFRLSRPLPDGVKSARVTLDRAGRWHVSFAAAPDQIDGPRDGSVVGIDRGIAIDYQASDGRRWDVPGLRPTEQARLLQLQRKMARQVKGSNRRARTKHQVARLRARETDRRKDAIEKATTDLARTADVVAVEDLRVKQMMRSAKGTIETPGTNVAAKRGLNRSIAETGWAMFARRLGDKIGDRLVLVPAAHTSTTCSACGHSSKENRLCQASFRCVACGLVENADVNAARNIAAGRAVSGRGGKPAIRGPGEASTSLVGAA